MLFKSELYKKIECEIINIKLELNILYAKLEKEVRFKKQSIYLMNLYLGKIKACEKVLNDLEECLRR